MHNIAFYDWRHSNSLLFVRSSTIIVAAVFGMHSDALKVVSKENTVFLHVHGIKFALVSFESRPYSLVFAFPTLPLQ